VGWNAQIISPVSASRAMIAALHLLSPGRWRPFHGPGFDVP
jgi:hypothetical protein